MHLNPPCILLRLVRDPEESSAWPLTSFLSLLLLLLLLSCQPVGVFSGTGYTLSGQTYPGQQPPAYGFPSSSTAAYAPQGQAFVPGQFAASMGMPAVPEEARLMTTYSLGRAVKMLAIIDGIMLLINSFVFGFFVLLFAWGPVCGYLSSQRYQPNLALAYLVYYVLRIAFDLTMTILGVWCVQAGHGSRSRLPPSL